MAPRFEMLGKLVTEKIKKREDWNLNMQDSRVQNLDPSLEAV